MKNEIQEFRILFDAEVGEFIYKHLREVTYKTVAHAQIIGNSYVFYDDKVLTKAHREVEYFLDCFKINLMNCIPSLEAAAAAEAAEEGDTEGHIQEDV